MHRFNEIKYQRPSCRQEGMTTLSSRSNDQKDGGLMNQSCRSSNEVRDYWVGRMAVTISSPILALPSQGTQSVSMGFIIKLGQKRKAITCLIERYCPKP